METGKIYRFSGYFVDPTQKTTKEQVADHIAGLGKMQQLHVEDAYYCKHGVSPVEKKNCDLADCEMWFDHEKEYKAAKDVIFIGAFYRHFKGKVVKVLNVAKNSETLQMQVVYECEDGSTWVRPLSMFTSKVDKFKYPDVKQEYRFEFTHKVGAWRRKEMSNEEAMNVLRYNKEMFEFNPDTGETVPMDKECAEAAEAIGIAMEALKKQIPMKPRTEELKLVAGYKVCPCCSTQDIFDNEGNELGFCSSCGQAIDWSERNE